jgi:hypothetical protein
VKGRQRARRALALREKKARTRVKNNRRVLMAFELLVHTVHSDGKFRRGSQSGEG